MKVTRLIALAELALLMLIIAGTVFTCCALSVAYEVHQARIESAVGNIDLKRQVFRRWDEMLWKADTALELGGAFKIEFGQLLTNVRTQVKQAADESSKDTKQVTHAATATITHAIEKQTDALNAVAEQAAPEGAAPAKPPVVVNVPAPVVLAPTPEGRLEQVSPRPPITLRLARPRRWWRLWLW